MDDTDLLQPPPPGDVSTLPLCVDLDDTLLRTDTLLESVFAVLSHNPLRLLPLPFLLLSRGRAGFKRALVEAGGVSATHLPYREELIQHLREAKEGGRTLVLATASDRAWADAVAGHLGLFDEVLASDGETNLKSAAKADALVERYGEKGFVYAGDAQADLAVWSRAGGAVLVGRGTKLEDRLPEGVTVEARFPERGGGLRALVRALRPYQWAKNALVFVPPLAAHVLHEREILVPALLMFAAFCAAASGIYVVNDLLDLEADRKHPRKRRRPFASGALSLRFGWIGPALVVLGLVLASRVSTPAAGMILLYAAITTAYSTWLKTQPLVDIFTLAALYMLRILGGGVATDIRVSIWLLGFSSFLFLALACLKRVAELDDADTAPGERVARRGYMPVDVLTLRLMGVASSFASVLVLSLYVDTTLAEELYAAPAVLWLIVPLLLFWQCRLWLSAGRGRMHDDPLVFALKDRVSWLVVVCVAVVFVLASGGLP